MATGFERRNVPPSAYGFRAILPRTRHERVTLKDKVALEKNRLNQRVGWQARLHKANAPETSALLTSCTAGAAGYLSKSDLYHTDTVGEEYAARQERIKKQQAAAEYKRYTTAKRDEDRWNNMESKQKEEDERWNKLREDGSKAKKNQSNVAYDILTIQYNDDADGEHQKYLDDQVRYRAAVRSNDLVVKGDTRVGYNIISGAPRSPLVYPDPIPKPGAVLRNEPMSARVDRRVSLAPQMEF